MQAETAPELGYSVGYLMGRGICCLLVVGAVVWAVVALIRAATGRGKGTQPHQEPAYPSYPVLPTTVSPNQITLINTKINLWSRNQSYVDAVLRPDGALEFLGHDLNPQNPWGAEYEYALRVEPVDVPRVVAALGGRPGDNVLALVRAYGEHIVRRGEQTWLRSLGIEPGFWSRVGDEL
ncbi:MAG TPA: hypothetical protein VFO77_14590 [Actinoplanes sp.]|nr:hypothetical protein [Actinoplanes sp.]